MHPLILAETLASIPSPGSGSIDIGPFTLRAYGVMIALGVLAAVWLVARRLDARGFSPDHATGIAMWCVPAGLVGARAYHVVTDWRRFQGNWGDAFKIWEGGLGILGGVIAGTAAGLYYVHRHDIPLRVGLDIAAPALPLAQAIGRWGNWFNQELFGKPTDVPWALEIDVEHRPPAHVAADTFHPTFLYESLWNVAVVFFLLWLERRGRLRPGRLFAVYLAAYSLGRLWVEALRIDTASEIAGLRVNLWVYSVVLAASLVVIVLGWRHGQDRATADPVTVSDATDTSAGDTDASDDDDGSAEADDARADSGADSGAQGQ